VYVIKPDQTANLRTITEGTTDGTTESVQGVQSGEVVAVNGFDKLQEGAKVAATNSNNGGNNKGAAANGANGSAAGSSGSGSASGGSHP
jgi:multidrug efflux system membrane fusion protein